MSYECDKCKKNCTVDWCLNCNEATKINHECEVESDRYKDLQYGDGWTTTINFNYCDECGWIDI